MVLCVMAVVNGHTLVVVVWKRLNISCLLLRKVVNGFVHSVRCGEIAPHIRDRVMGDGNCLFRTISKEITGTEENHTAVRLAALGYLRENPSLISYGAPTFNIDPSTDPMRRAQLQEEAVSRYISTHNMD